MSHIYGFSVPERGAGKGGAVDAVCADSPQGGAREPKRSQQRPPGCPEQGRGPAGSPPGPAREAAAATR